MSGIMMSSRIRSGGGSSSGGLQRPLAAVGDLGAVVVLQQPVHQREVFRRVVDDQDGGLGGGVAHCRFSLECDAALGGGQLQLLERGLEIEFLHRALEGRVAAVGEHRAERRAVRLQVVHRFPVARREQAGDARGVRGAFVRRGAVRGAGAGSAARRASASAAQARGQSGLECARPPPSRPCSPCNAFSSAAASAVERRAGRCCRRRP